MKKLLLIQAVGGLRKGLSLTQSKYPSLALGILANLTPPNWEIELLDSLSDSVFDKEADLVAITSYTPTVNNAYIIAQHYRNKGLPVVLGGIHASLMPDEAAKYCTSVAIGEAEGIWNQIIKDFEKGELKQVYKANNSNSICSPKRELFSKNYNLTTIQASRGCPMNCDYCSVSLLSGKIYRKRPVNDIINDWKHICKNFVWFADDNLFGFNENDRAWARELFSEIINQKLQKNWMCFAGVKSLLDEKTIALAAESGCKIIYIGFETTDKLMLDSVNKRSSQLKFYEKVISNLHKHGIAVLAGIMLGFDNDTPESIERRIDFVLESDIDSYFLTVTTPMPGTRLFDKYLKANKLIYTNFPNDWDHYDWTELVYKPAVMTVNQAEKAINLAYQKAYSYSTIKSKFKNSRSILNSADTALLNYISNMDFRETFLNRI